MVAHMVKTKGPKKNKKLNDRDKDIKEVMKALVNKIAYQHIGPYSAICPKCHAYEQYDMKPIYGEFDCTCRVCGYTWPSL